MASAADAGKAINRLACVQQIDGAAIMGLGMAMMEEVAFDAAALDCSDVVSSDDGWRYGLSLKRI